MGAIAVNVPVTTSNDALWHESVAGVDVGAHWVFLTQNPVVPEPANVDSSFHPPTERDAIVTLILHSRGQVT